LYPALPGHTICNAWLISLTAIRRKREVREKEEGEKKNSLRLGVSLIFYLLFFFSREKEL